MRHTEFDQMLASAVMEMTREQSLPATVERAVALVVDTIGPCDAAAVMLFVGGRPTTVTASDPALADLAEDHVDRGSSPALSAYVGQSPVCSGDLSADLRWPAFAETMVETFGFRSLYAVPLPHADADRDKPLGVLVAYAKVAGAFDSEEQETVRLLAVHATAALTDAVQQAQLHAALDSRTVIGQATGIVMERFALDASAAFAVLRRLSQTENVKLRDVAARIVETGEVD
jgi:GAF domain-containing protein